MKKYGHAVLFSLFIGIASVTGCSNSDASLQNKVVPESTTVSLTTETEEITEKESSGSDITEDKTIIESTISSDPVSNGQETSETLAENSENSEITVVSETTGIAETTIIAETVMAEIYTEPTTTIPIVLQGYLFEAEGIQIGMHEDAENVLAVLGNPDAYFETPSCAFLGMDKQYTYGGYMLTTYEENGRDYVYDVYFLDETVSTPEGIRIGSGIDEMIAAYGDGYTEDFGMYTYVKERSKLQFLIVDGIITSVDYTALTD